MRSDDVCTAAVAALVRRSAEARTRRLPASATPSCDLTVVGGGPRIRSVLRLALLVALVTAATAGVAAREATAVGQATTTINLISGNARETVTDKAPKELARGVASKGDVLRGTSVLRNAVRQFGKPSGAVVGRDTYSFTFVSPTEAIIDVRVQLPGGTLRARGRMRLPQGDRLVVTVTGGTGRFAGARGTGEARTLAPGESLNVYRLRFPETA